MTLGYENSGKAVQKCIDLRNFYEASFSLGIMEHYFYQKDMIFLYLSIVYLHVFDPFLNSWKYKNCTQYIINWKKTTLKLRVI